ncbi:MAG: nucleotide exchange factor GrpE [Candidatus Eiseniibacteriota bacterium]|nr:MAG: nucleotide exchange factor GrpE [Candidatus Eisenbacteria bacterium]
MVKKRKVRREPSPLGDVHEIPIQEGDEAPSEKDAAAGPPEHAPREGTDKETGEKTGLENGRETVGETGQETGEKPDQKSAGEEDLAQEYLEQLQRVQAEFANYRKRVQREMLEAYDYAKAELVCRFLPVMDDLERAIESLAPNCENDNAAKGVRLIYDKLKSTLQAEGVEPIECKGMRFDPNFHEAVMVTKVEEGEDSTVVKDIQKGYTYKGKLIRPSKVEVTQLDTTDTGDE